MSKFWIDFQGYCLVEAKTADEAIDKVWKNFPSHIISNDDETTFEVDGVEEKGD